jgi:NtrC-family two-component system response regulator AlgB
VAEGAFREDLYFRLNVITVEMPPLRARSGDLIRFAEYYLRHFAAQCGRRLDGFAEETAASLLVHSWPGNLRELSNAIERAVIMARESKISPADLPAEVRQTQNSGASMSATSASQPGDPISLEKLEELHIRRVLEKTPSLSQAADTLGIDQATLYRKRKKLGLE